VTADRPIAVPLCGAGDGRAAGQGLPPARVPDTEPPPAPQEGAAEPVLRVEALSKAFGGVTALDCVTLDAREMEVLSVIGPNGAGKTTLFNVLSGLYRADSGRIRFRGHDLGGLMPDRVAGLGIGRTFQNIRLFGAMTVFENVLVGLHTRGRYSYLAALLRTPGFTRIERQLREEALGLLAYVGLRERATQLARHLPYGAQRRLEIARALALRPSLLLLDEPAAGMNPQETAELVAFLERLRTEHRLTLVLIEHHMQVVMRISDRVVVLDYGRTIAEGSPAEVRSDPRVIEAYLGRSGREVQVS
jgi:branched-chain amino acid transport system ATP-binding protein